MNLLPTEQSTRPERVNVQFGIDDERIIPLSWTDLGEISVDKGCVYFELEKLIELRIRLDSLCSVKTDSSSLKLEGGNNGKAERIMGESATGETETPVEHSIADVTDVAAGREVNIR